MVARYGKLFPNFTDVSMIQAMEFERGFWVASENGLVGIRFDSNSSPDIEVERRLFIRGRIPKVTDLHEIRDIPQSGDERLLVATREGFYFDIFNGRVKVVGAVRWHYPMFKKIHYSRFGHVLCGSDKDSINGRLGLMVIPQVCSLQSTSPGVISWDCRGIVNELAERVVSGSARLQLLRATSANGRYEVVDEVSGDPMSLTNIYTEDKYLNGGSFFYKARYPHGEISQREVFGNSAMRARIFLMFSLLRLPL